MTLGTSHVKGLDEDDNAIVAVLLAQDSWKIQLEMMRMDLENDIGGFTRD